MANEKSRADLATPSAMTPEVVTEAQVRSACLSYRHDFGLLDEQEQARVMLQSREWFHAWRKELPAAMTPEVRAVVPDAMRQMIVQAVRFANLAAGEGICIDDLEPETFLFDYSNATDDEDWHTLADRVDAALRGIGGEG